MNTITLISQKWIKVLSLCEENIAGKIISFLGKGQRQNTHMHNLCLLLKGSEFFSSAIPTARHSQWVFCKWNFKTFQMRHYFLLCYNDDNTNNITMNERVFLTPDWTNLSITEAFNVGDNKRSISLE